jgi:hypothetical protein
MAGFGRPADGCVLDHTLRVPSLCTANGLAVDLTAQRSIHGAGDQVKCEPRGQKAL